MTATTPEHIHCWHATGMSPATCMTSGNSGTSCVRCCHCGLSGVRPFKDKLVPRDGHGQFDAVETRVYGEVITHPPLL